MRYLASYEKHVTKAKVKYENSMAQVNLKKVQLQAKYDHPNQASFL